MPTPDTLAPVTPPPSAIPIWTDGRDLYTIIPGPQGPVMLRYPRTSAGLSAALGLITTRAYDTAAGPAQPSPASGTSPRPNKTAVALDKLRALGLRV